MPPKSTTNSPSRSSRSLSGSPAKFRCAANACLPRYVFPNVWPLLHSALDCYCLTCGPEALLWISRNRTFYFKVDSCLGALPRVPRLYLFSVSHESGRKERFRAGHVRFVGAGALPLRDRELPAEGNAVYVAVELFRTEKREFDYLLAHSPEPQRGRRPDAALNLSDFAPSEDERAAVSHWVQNPTNVVEAPYAAVARALLPNDVREACNMISATDISHPFSAYIRAPFQDNRNVDFRHYRSLFADAAPRFSFIDLFAGIGGFRLAMQQEGGRCVFSSEIDPAARETYERNFRVLPFGDITKEETKAMIPRRFDLLCGGFPCQAFSMAGKRQGIEDLQRGTLYREIVDIAARHQPKALLLENVRGLLSSHGGRDWETIRREIEGAGYHVVFDSILNSKNYGVPQNRDRLYVVALRNDLFARMETRRLSFPAKPPRAPGPDLKCIGNIRERNPAAVSKSFYLGESYLETLVRHKSNHKDTGRSGFGFIVRNDNDIAGTLMCGGMGRERNMLQDTEDFQSDWTPPAHMKGKINAFRYRFMTIRERARLQGFPDCFLIPDSISAGQKQFGNCVTVGAVRAVGRALVNLLERIEEN